MSRMPSGPARSGPRDPSSLPPLPHGRTARRMDWLLLPPAVRRLVEARVGPVVAAESAGAGFTPGLASVLTGADGRRTFLKAASRKAQRPFADAYALEARRLRDLPRSLPVPRLLWSHADDLWVVLALEHLDGANPDRPWREDQLASCLDTLEELADALTPPPMRLRSLADELAGQAACWDHVRATAPGWPHLEEAAQLASRFAGATQGGTLVHTDVRDDNLLLDGHGRAWLCDWNFPVVGAAWVDTVCLLMTAAGDGVDTDALLAERRLTRDVPADDVDAVLALLCGFFLRQRDSPVPHSSPYLRRHQDWCAEASWAWLARRRGWA